MKSRHARVLGDFEASSVILFAALVSGDFSLSHQALSVPAGRAEFVSSARSLQVVSRRAAVPTESAEAGGVVNVGRRHPIPNPYAFTGSAVAQAIARMESGQLQGFVPFHKPVRA